MPECVYWRAYFRVNNMHTYNIYIQCHWNERWRRNTLRINYVRELNGQTKKAATETASEINQETETVDINERAYGF